MDGTAADGLDPAYDGYTDDGEPFDYHEYRAPPHQHSVAAYRDMVGQDWVDEPLRELLETRLDELLEG